MALYTLAQANATVILEDIEEVSIGGSYSHHKIPVDDQLGNILHLDCIVPEGAGATLAQCKTAAVVDLQLMEVYVAPAIGIVNKGGKDDTLG